MIRAGAMDVPAGSSFTIDVAGPAMLDWRVLRLPDRTQALFVRRREVGTDLSSITDGDLARALRRWPDSIGDGFVVFGKGDEWQVSLAPTSSLDLFAALDEDGSLLLSGTVAGLLQQGLPHANLDVDALADRFVGALTVDSADTVARGIRRIIGGHEVRVIAERLSISRWWEPRKLTVHRDLTLKRAGAELRRIAHEVVQRNLPVHGPVAVHLSGGRDSSVLCALAASQLADEGRTVHAFTALPCANLPDGDKRYQFDEGSAAAATAARYRNVEHHLCRPAPMPLTRILDDLHRRIGEPIHQPVSLGWIWPQLSRCSGLGLSTLLTGDSGNFTVSTGGLLNLSDVWREEGLAPWFRTSAKVVRSGGVTLRDLVRESFGGSLPLPLYSAGRKRGQPVILANDFPFFKGVLRGKVLAISPQNQDPRPPASARAIIQEIAANRCNPMPLGRFDFGVELLAPWNDRKLFELVLSAPSSMLASAPDRRLLFEEAFGDLVPEEILRPQRRGQQNVDFHAAFDCLDLQTAVERYRASAQCREMIDLDRLAEAAARWPTERHTDRRHVSYWIGQFLPALSLASFLNSSDFPDAGASAESPERLHAGHEPHTG
ncbi:asparagine synthase-related protein [Sphingomonas glaciei]|uniref:asparagine synthase (glutamine-hydrolyzing) n=1 Tax=Sphingomonas glaciei TaxID=2938948 RepID=A0ABY5MXH3_9SPHN|nr:asparagine synthase-related protein [Sphingomonas glaciei]UUR08691.1 asparagine synthase-related protein [Sphingomonas glaciei]